MKQRAENNSENSGKIKSSFLKALYITLTVLLVFISYLAFFSAKWSIKKYGDVGFDAILFTLFSNLSGTSVDLILNYIKFTIPKTFLFSGITLFLLLFRNKKALFIRIAKKIRLRVFPFNRITSAVISLLMSSVLIINAAYTVGIPLWLKNSFTDSMFIENEYVSPNDVQITFPTEKRNLIYIYLESMETTFLSSELGGALDYNVIPELYRLANENVNFSQDSGVGGCLQLSGASWTIGAMVSQSAGIPLKLPIEGNSYGYYSKFLPGVTSLTDILSSNGYYQMFLVGSDATFGGRSNYYSQHSVNEICDYYTAITDGIIVNEYHNGWWGMEDSYVYAYAKQKLTELAERDEPFAFVSADTHHIGGYKCDLCQSNYRENYENVYACASKQLFSFIKWVKQQDFYENTTIIISGDHCSMDSEYMTGNVSPDYDRRIFNCFINSAVLPVNSKNRIFSQVDMFPSTLAALGAEISGNRLGLGVNLFSDLQTLSEKYGFAEFNNLINQNSNYYNNKFLYNR